MTTKRDVCEVRAGDGWEERDVLEVLTLDPRPAMRCPECWGGVRPHKEANNGMRAHFEHLVAHKGCRLGSNFSGTPSQHPSALT